MPKFSVSSYVLVDGDWNRIVETVEAESSIHVRHVILHKHAADAVRITACRRLSDKED